MPPRFGRSADWKSAIRQVGNPMPLTFGVQGRGVQSRRDCISQPRVARNELPWVRRITIQPTLKGLQPARPGVPRPYLAHMWLEIGDTIGWKPNATNFLY